MAIIIDGKELAKKIRANLKIECEELKNKQINPKLAVIMVGDDPASKVYVRNKSKVCEDVGIEYKEYLLSSLETALVTAYKRNFDSAENVKVNMDENTGDIKVYAVKTVVEEVLDDQLEISLEEAKKENKNAKIGQAIANVY